MPRPTSLENSVRPPKGSGGDMRGHPKARKAKGLNSVRKIPGGERRAQVALRARGDQGPKSVSRGKFRASSRA